MRAAAEELSSQAAQGITTAATTTSLARTFAAREYVHGQRLKHN